MELKFKIDTKHRKQWFTGISFSHPAKMSLPLQLWIIDNYTKEGEVILDPMAGSGTLLVACSMGRNVVCVELEDKFVKIMEGNWEKIQQRGPQLGYQMGAARIIQGDARNLQGLMADAIISSPPYEASVSDNKESPLAGGNQQKYGRWKDGTARKISYTQDKKCKADAIISSPPYAEQVQGSRHSDHQPEQRRKRLIKAGYNPNDYQLGKGRQCEVIWEYGKETGQIGNLPYGHIDAVITSPPYKEQMQDVDWIQKNHPGKYRGTHDPNTQSEGNIGNLKSDSYLQAMLQVYSECYRVLKSQGIMVLVTKDFIRDRKRIDLAGDTIKLCEQAGFHFVERHYRKLSAMSFWRVIYYQKNPEVEKLDTEDILVFRKLWS